MLYNCLRKAQDLLFPAHCILCGCKSARTIDLCHACEADLPWATRACLHCGRDLSATQANHEVCGQCIQKPSVIRHIFPLWQYQPPLDKLITSAKFQGRLMYSYLFGELMSTQVLEKWYKNQPLPDLIIAMPLHKKRLRERGYNQALEIARPMARRLNIPLDRHSCQRSRATSAQTELSAEARARNVKDAFMVRHPMQAKHVAIVDDVVTTGNTVHALALCLKNAGIQTIDVWCCARTNI
jgi:ComF family protein